MGELMNGFPVSSQYAHRFPDLHFENKEEADKKNSFLLKAHFTGLVRCGQKKNEGSLVFFKNKKGDQEPTHKKKTIWLEYKS